MVYVQDFQAFAEENPGVFEAAGTSQEEALTKMRLMALLGLGAHPHPVPLADVQVRLSFSLEPFLSGALSPSEHPSF